MENKQKYFWIIFSMVVCGLFMIIFLSSAVDNVLIGYDNHIQFLKNLSGFLFFTWLFLAGFYSVKMKKDN
jgi:hypothetical protein